MKHVFGGTVKGGSVVFDDPPRWRGVVARFEGRRVTVTVRRETYVRSLKQNAYYFGVVVPIFGEWTGYEKDEAHEVLKGLHLKVRKALPTGEEIETAGSTRVLSTEDFAHYVDRVCRWMAEQGVYVPAPGESIEAAL